MPRGSKPGERRGGRKKGAPNKVTTDARTAISKIIEGNADKVQGWLNRTAVKKPDRALDLYLKLCEFGIPKLGRVEHTGPGGGALTIQVVRFADNPNPEELAAS
jgi:hypothetical protein